MPRGNMRIGRSEIEASAINFTGFIQALSQQLGRTIVDKTGLPNGLYDIKLKWTPEVAQAGGLAGPVLGGDAPPVDPAGPSIFTAVQEQLGLRLESGRGPVEVLVIDNVEKPSDN